MIDDVDDLLRDPNHQEYLYSVDGKPLIRIWADVEPINCHICNGESKYTPTWDAHFCPECNEWLQPACDQAVCIDCPYETWNRPERPLQNISLNV